MSLIDMSTTYVSGKGHAIAHLILDQADGNCWLAYTVSKVLWQPHWQRVTVPISDGIGMPRSVCLAATDTGELIATVRYENDYVAVAKLETNPNWKIISSP